MQIKIIKTKGGMIPKNGRPSRERQTIGELEEEINNFIQDVKVIDIKHVFDNDDIHYFTVLYEE